MAAIPNSIRENMRTSSRRHTAILGGVSSVKQRPLYKSKRKFQNLWQEYRIFDDRVVLTTFFTTITVPFEQVEGITVANSYKEGLRAQMRGGRLGFKLDWADFYKHVVLDKVAGWFRHLAFTQDDPEIFRATLEAALTRYRERPHGKE
jgi:hypothetical protein